MKANQQNLKVVAFLIKWWKILNVSTEGADTSVPMCVIYTVYMISKDIVKLNLGASCESMNFKRSPLSVITNKIVHTVPPVIN